MNRHSSQLFGASQNLRSCGYRRTKPSWLLQSLSEFVYLGKVFGGSNDAYDPVALSVRLANVHCGPLYRSHVSPDDELRAFVAAGEN
jgi:hypothetical protein